MKKVITYGTFDLLHYGHIKLLERAKALGDYLIVGVTSDDFDKSRGKINVKESLMERIENVRKTGIADQIIVEEYEGQKIDDIKNYNVDIFTVGSDWVGKFDYLKEFCTVTYLDRTQGVSSTAIRSKKQDIKLGIIGKSHILKKYIAESKLVNGLSVVNYLNDSKNKADFFSSVDAVYIVSHPIFHYSDCKEALLEGKHVLCEAPLALCYEEAADLFRIASEKNLVLAEGIKTAYSTAYSRMILLAKSGKIGDIVSIDSTCTSLVDIDFADSEARKPIWDSLSAWGPTALLPIFDLLGTKWNDLHLYSRIWDEKTHFDDFSKISINYDTAICTATVGKGVKSEGNLIIAGTKGYIYVPAPWWKTDYFEIRYENQSNNKRYFYQLEGEGIRYELLSFIRMINENAFNPISTRMSLAIAKIMSLKTFNNNNVHRLSTSIAHNR